MSLSNLSADALAKVDALCIDFENRLRRGEPADIEAVLAEYDGAEAAALREELVQVQSEVLAERAAAANLSTESAPTESKIFADEGSGNSRSVSKAARPLLAIGTKIGPYEIKKLIGVGGMGQVFLGYDGRLSRSVAIKVLADDFSDADAGIQQHRSDRFAREARAVATLKHANIVHLYDVGTFEGRPYAVMEFLEGVTLRERMRSGQVPPEEVRRLGVSAAEALSVAHANGIVHRDLKPENLFVLNDGTLKLLDFGLSRYQADGDSGSDRTATGVIMGTLGYLSPEQARGDEVTPQADIFSLGCVLYETFYSARPFHGRTASETLASILNDSSALRDAEIEQRDPQLADIIHACIAKNRDLRIATAGELAEALRGSSTVANFSSDANRGDEDSLALTDRRSWMRYLGGAVVGAGGFAAFQFYRQIPSSLANIHSIAVLPLEVEYSEGASPIRSHHLAPGEELAAVLADKLLDITQLEVRPFHAVKQALDEGDANSVAKQLNVDAVVRGRVIKSETTQQIVLTVQPTSENLNPITEVFNVANDTSLVEVSKRAETIARIIGRQLEVQEGRTRDQQSYRCFVDGTARLDPAKLEAIEDSLHCFQHAIDRDEDFSEAYAARAMAHVLLLQAGKPQPDSLNIIRSDVDRALKLKPTSAYGNLANAVMAWQLNGEVDSARVGFEAAIVSMPKDWLIHYQHSHFLLALGQRADALVAIDKSRTFDPTATMLQLVAARLKWLSGEKSAVASALAILIRNPDNADARGLLLDMLEQEKRLELASLLLSGKQPTSDFLSRDRAVVQPTSTARDSRVAGSKASEEYWAAREATLQEFQYTPFGDPLNRLVFDFRSTATGGKRPLSVLSPGELDVELRVRFESAASPWLRFLIATHPALDAAGQTQFGKSLLSANISDLDQ